MARTLLETHQFVPHVYTAAYAIVQTFWGAACCAVFGYSYTVLRVSTLLLSLVTIWLTALCARELGCTRRTALLAGGVLFANPLFLNLSYTFMTEVPFMVLAVASCFFYLRALRRGKTLDILLGGVFAVLSLCNRQYGVLITVAFIVSLAISLRKPLRRPKPGPVAALLAPWLTFAVLFLLIAGVPENGPQTLGLAGNLSRVKHMGMVLKVVLSLPVYVGLFLLPFAVAVLLQGREQVRHWRSAGRLACFTIVAAYTLFILAGGPPMPYLPNMLRNAGVGPLTLYDTYFAHRNWSPATFAPVVWKGVTIAAAIASGTLVASWQQLLSGKPRIKRIVPPVRRAQYWFLFVLGGLFLLSPLNPKLTVYYDRYLLPGLVPLLLLSAKAMGLRPRPRAQWTAFAATLVLYLFSLASLQDYLAWNRARWAAIDRLRAQYGAELEQIDGGYEFNGLYTSEKFRALHPNKPVSYSGERPWWVIENRFAVSFLPRDGYQQIDEVSYPSWLRRGGGRLLILQRVH